MPPKERTRGQKLAEMSLWANKAKDLDLDVAYLQAKEKFLSKQREVAAWERRVAELGAPPAPVALPAPPESRIPQAGRRSRPAPRLYPTGASEGGVEVRRLELSNQRTLEKDYGTVVHVDVNAFPLTEDTVDDILKGAKTFIARQGGKKVLMAGVSFRVVRRWAARLGQS